MTRLLTYAKDFLVAIFMSRNAKAWKFTKKNPVELKHCETSSSCWVLYLMKLKSEKERYYLILEYDYVT